MGDEDSMGLPADYRPADFSKMAPIPTMEQLESTPVAAPSMRSGAVAQDTIGDAISESNGDGLFGLGRFLG
jgi:hypothetical protein